MHARPGVPDSPDVQAVLAKGVQQEVAAMLQSDMKGRLNVSTKPLPWLPPRSQRTRQLAHDCQLAKKAAYVDKPTSVAARLFLQVRNSASHSNSTRFHFLQLSYQVCTSSLCVQERFGIPCMQPGDAQHKAAKQVASRLEGLVLGGTTRKPELLPDTVRTGAAGPAPLKFVDREIKYGLCHLINRGIIPAHSDVTSTLTGPDNVLHTVAARLRPHGERFVQYATDGADGTVAAYRCGPCASSAA